MWWHNSSIEPKRAHFIFGSTTTVPKSILMFLGTFFRFSGALNYHESTFRVLRITQEYKGVFGGALGPRDPIAKEPETLGRVREEPRSYMARSQEAQDPQDGHVSSQQPEQCKTTARVAQTAKR